MGSTQGRCQLMYMQLHKVNDKKWKVAMDQGTWDMYEQEAIKVWVVEVEAMLASEKEER